MLIYNILQKETEELLSEIAEYADVTIGQLTYEYDENGIPYSEISEITFKKDDMMDITATISYGSDFNWIGDLVCKDVPLRMPFHKDTLIKIAKGEISQKDAFEKYACEKTLRELDGAPRIQRLYDDPEVSEFSVLENGVEMHHISFLQTDAGKAMVIEPTKRNSTMPCTARDIDFWMKEGHYQILPNDVQSLEKRAREIKGELYYVKSREYAESVVFEEAEAYDEYREMCLYEEMRLINEKLKDLGIEVPKDQEEMVKKAEDEYFIYVEQDDITR